MAQAGHIPRLVANPYMLRGIHSPLDVKEVENMNKNTLKKSLRMMIVLGALVLIAQGVSAQGDADTTETTESWGKDMGAGIALGLAGLGAGFSQGSIGSAAVGMLAEDSSKFGPALIFTALPESIVILGALPLFL
jgi:V/A-type H+-transporting ATPase subunit K